MFRFASALLFLAALGSNAWAQSQNFVVELWDDADCSGSLGSFFVAATVDVQDAVEERVASISNFANTDGLTVNGGACHNIEKSSDYTVQGLAALVVGRLNVSFLQHVQLWDESNCSQLLGEFFIAEDAQVQGAVEAHVMGVESFANTDGISIGGTCHNAENSSDYSAAELASEILSHIGFGSLRHIEIWDESNCSKLLGEFFIAENADVQSTVEERIGNIAQFENADGLGVDGQCFNIEKSSDYTIAGLASQVLARLGLNAFNHVQLWDESNCTDLLGEFFIGESGDLQSAVEARVAAIPSFENTDGLSINGACQNIEKSSDYTVEQLAGLVLGEFDIEGVVRVELWDESNCTDLLGAFLVPTDADIQGILEERIAQVPSFENTDGVSIDDACHNIEKSSDYSVQQLGAAVLARFENDFLRHVEVWDESNCSKLLGEFFVAETDDVPTAVEGHVGSISQFENADGVSIDGTCHNIENSSDYTVQSLSVSILEHLNLPFLRVIRLWDESNCSKLLGGMLVAETADIQAVLEERIAEVEDFANTDGVTVDGTCTNIEKSSDYTPSQLAVEVIKAILGN